MEHNKKQQLEAMQQMVTQQSWVKTPWRYATLGRGDLSLMQQQALLMVSGHLQGYIKRFFDLGLDKAHGKPKSLFTEYVLKQGIPPFRIYLQDIGVSPSHYNEARKVIDEINLKVEHPAFDEDGNPTGETKLTNVFSQFGFEDTGEYYRFGDDDQKQAVKIKQPWIDVKINPDVAEWAFDMSQGYVNHLKMIALYSTKRPTPRVYLLLMRALKKNDQRCDLRVPLGELKEYLGIMPYQDKSGNLVTPYPMFSNFKQKVLDAVQQDLERMACKVPPQTDITFTYEPVYPGRRKKGDPEAILFHIERTVLGVAYGVVVNHAKIPVQQDLFDDQYQQTWRRCMDALCADERVGNVAEKLRQMSMEHYDAQGKSLLIQVPSKGYYQWVEGTADVLKVFYEYVCRHFGKGVKLDYRLPRV